MRIKKIFVMAILVSFGALGGLAKDHDEPGSVMPTSLLRDDQCIKDPDEQACGRFCGSDCPVDHEYRSSEGYQRELELTTLKEQALWALKSQLAEVGIEGSASFFAEVFVGEPFLCLNLFRPEMIAKLFAVVAGVEPLGFLIQVTGAKLETEATHFSAKVTIYSTKGGVVRPLTND